MNPLYERHRMALYGFVLRRGRAGATLSEMTDYFRSWKITLHPVLDVERFTEARFRDLLLRCQILPLEGCWRTGTNEDIWVADPARCEPNGERWQPREG